MARIAFLLMITILVITGCSQDLPQVDIYQCSQDSDCIAVNSGCCGCNSGGEAVAINKEYEQSWNDNLSKECGRIGCISVISQDISCFSKPACVNNACTLNPNKDDVCNSLLVQNCRDNTPQENWDRKENGISCREVIEMCN